MYELAPSVMLALGAVVVLTLAVALWNHLEWC